MKYFHQFLCVFRRGIFKYLLLCVALISPSLFAEDGIFADFTTTEGNFTVKLFYSEAPITVANFVGLVEGTREYVDAKTGVIMKKEGYYDGLTFHRVIEGFMNQGGCPLGTGTGGPGYVIKDEVLSGL